MTPQDRQELEQLKQTVAQLKAVEDIAFIANIFRRLEDKIDEKIAAVQLNDLADVDTSGVTNGQVIKYNSTSGEWENADDIDT